MLSSFGELALPNEISADLVVQLDLIVECKLRYYGLQHRANGDMVFANERRVVDVRKESHQELAIKAVSKTTVARDAVAEILDVESTFESARKESAKRRDQAGKRSHDESVQLERRPRERRDTVTCNRGGQRRHGGWQGKVVPVEDWVDVAGNLLERIHAQADGRADHVVVALEEGGPTVCKDLGDDECTHETLDRLLGAEVDQRRPAKRHTTNVSKDIVANHERGGHPEPDETLENVVDDKVAGKDDEKQRHVHPAEQAKLMLEVATF